MKIIETNTDLGNYLIQIAKEYAVKMNELEKRICELDKNNVEDEMDVFEEYKKEYNPIFQQYATSKKRVYGGQADSYGTPPKYDGIEKETVGQVTLKSKIKAEVYFKINNAFDAEYLFVLHKETDDWKIDNVKYKWYNKEKWNKLIM